MADQELQELTCSQYQSVLKSSHQQDTMGGTRKPSARVRTTLKKETADAGGRNEDHPVKKELDNDISPNLTPLQDGPHHVIPFGQPSQALTSPSTPGYRVSSSPMPPSSSGSGQLVLPPGRKKGASMILWNYTEKPVPYQGSGNGRQRGRNLIQWSRPRMYEKLLLHLQYELNRHNVAVPWDFVAHRFHPGSSGQALLQHLNRIRPILLAEGHLVPPICQKPGAKKPVPVHIRGYIRADPDGDDCISTRPVPWSEPIFDRQFSLPNAHNDRSITGSAKRYQMGGEYVYPARKDELKRKPDAARMGVTESAKKPRHSSRKASAAASYAMHDDDETDVEQGDDHDQILPVQWVADGDGDGEGFEDDKNQELFLSPEGKVPALDYNRTPRYPDLVIDDDDEDSDLQQAIQLSRQVASSPLRRQPNTAMSSVFSTQPTDSTQSTVKGDVAAQLAFYKKQCEILLRERKANVARHEVELAEARLDGEKHGIVAGFHMARQYPDLHEPPSFTSGTLESPDTKLSNTMRLTSMVGHGHATPTTRNPPTTPASNRPPMLTFSSHTQRSPTPGANSSVYAKPLQGSARGSGIRNMHPSMVYGVSHGRISPMLHQHDISYQSANVHNLNINNSPSNMFSSPSQASGSSFFNPGLPMGNLQSSPMLSNMSSQTATENTQPTNAMIIDNTGNGIKAGSGGSGSLGGNHTIMVHGQTSDVQTSNTPFMDAMASTNDMSGGLFDNGQNSYNFNQ